MLGHPTRSLPWHITWGCPQAECIEEPTHIVLIGTCRDLFVKKRYTGTIEAYYFNTGILMRNARSSPIPPDKRLNLLILRIFLDFGGD